MRCIQRSFRSLVRTLLMPSLLLGPAARTTVSHARMTPRLSGALQIPSPAGQRIAEEFIRRGHSHNDYHQASPLSSALRHGLNSVEVDVFPRDDKLLVAHTIFELDKSKTIEKLYTLPILSMLRRSGMATSDPRVTTAGDYRPFPQSRESQRKGMKTNSASKYTPLMSHGQDSLTLLVDLKGNAEKSMDLLHESLAPLRPFMSKVDKNGKFRQGKVTVVVSGNRPRDESLISGDAKGERYIFIDGRAHDIRAESDTTLVPMVSLPWRKLQLARLSGRGDRYMQRMVEQAHQQGKRLRIWGAPNSESLWHQMIRNNVDLLSIDEHGKFARFASQVGFST